MSFEENVASNKSEHQLKEGERLPDPNWVCSEKCNRDSLVTNLDQSRK